MCWTDIHLGGEGAQFVVCFEGGAHFVVSSEGGAQFVVWP